jgi:hypothetical protein
MSECVFDGGRRMTLHDLTAGHWLPIEPPIGPFMTALVESGDAVPVVSLSPVSLQRRVPFFHASVVDRETARHGALMNPETFGSYATPEIFILRLADVVIASSDGILLHAGRVVPDYLKLIMDWLPDSATAEFRMGEYLRLKAPLPMSASPHRGATMRTGCRRACRDCMRTGCCAIGCRTYG